MIFVWNLWLFGWHLRKTSFYEEFYSQNLATFRSIKFYGIGPSDTTDVLTQCANKRKIKINFFRENCRVEYILNFFWQVLHRTGAWRHLGDPHPSHQGHQHGGWRQLQDQGHQQGRNDRGVWISGHRHRGAELPQVPWECDNKTWMHWKLWGTDWINIFK